MNNMDDRDLEVRIVRLEYGQHSLEKKVDQHVRRLDDVSFGLDEIKKILLQIKWSAFGLLIGMGAAFASEMGAFTKLLKVFL